MIFIAPFIGVAAKVSFDAAKVTAAMARKTTRVLLDAGAFAAKVMRAGMRYSKRVSAVGAYPFTHTDGLRHGIQAGIDIGFRSGPDITAAARFAMIVGCIDDPVWIAIDAVNHVINRGKTVPQLVNEGGVSYRRIKRRKVGKVWKERYLGYETTYIRRDVYRPRPFVELTLPHAADRLAKNMETFDFS